MYSTLKRITTGMAAETVAFAQELVATPSPTCQEGGVARIIEKKMIELGYDQVFRDSAGNVIGILWGRENGPTVVLNGHMDTVTTDCSGPWDRDPFDATIEDGKLIGLGASDCKGGLAAQVYAGAVLKHSLLPLRGNLVVAATVAEENGASVGVRCLLSHTLPELNLAPSLVLLGEPTSLGLYYGHDGRIETKLVIESEGEGDLKKAAWAVYEMLQAQNTMQSQAAAQEEMLVRAPVMESDGRATMVIERRLMGPHKPDQVRGQIHMDAELVARLQGCAARGVEVREESVKLYTGHETTVRFVTRAWETDPFDPMLERARQCLRAAGCSDRPGKWRLNRLGMGTAGSAITNDFGIPALGYGPGDEEQAHRPGEFVDTNAIIEAVYGTAAITHGLIGVPVFGWTSDEI